ncbi:MAG TPA: ATP-binding protein [Acidobacteriaceae bacterium]|jgi:signal transduction histidine kinase
MKRHSLSRRLISSVLLVELVFAVAVIALAAVYERQSRLHAFDIMLQGRADSLLGAVQDAEDPADNVMLDHTGLQLPSEDLYEVRDSTGRVLGRSSNWQGPDAHDVASGQDRIFYTRANGHRYRVLALHGLRVVDPGDKGGGTVRHVLVFYGARNAQVWHHVRDAIIFFSFSNLVLLIVTGVLMAWLLHRGLTPVRQLAAEAENISIHRWSFRPPESAMDTRELAPLASALSAAMQRLEASFSQQRRFVSDAAHELKTAVAVVKSSLQLLNMRQRTPEEYEAGVEVSLADCERMEEIVARMLTLARAEHFTATDDVAGSSDLVTSVAMTAQQFQSMAEVRSVTLTVAAGEAAFVPLSSEECALLCSNLLLNALQHSPPQTEVKMLLQPEPSHVELRIEDQGDGIDPALLPHVFERFSRGDPSRSRNTGGTGLGLAICKAVVEKAGGTIELQNQVGHGAIAVVRLPRTTPGVDAPAEPALQASPSA